MWQNLIDKTGMRHAFEATFTQVTQFSFSELFKQMLIDLFELRVKFYLREKKNYALRV